MSLNNFSNLGNFGGGLNDDPAGLSRPNGMMDDFGDSMTDTLKSLEYLWKQKFLNLCTQAS